MHRLRNQKSGSRAALILNPYQSVLLCLLLLLLPMSHRKLSITCGLGPLLHAQAPRDIPYGWGMPDFPKGSDTVESSVYECPAWSGPAMDGMNFAYLSLCHDGSAIA